MDPFNFSNILLRIFESKPDRDDMARVRYGVWFRRQASGGRAATFKGGAKRIPASAANDDCVQTGLQEWPAARRYS